jgi:hypothetical protein
MLAIMAHRIEVPAHVADQVVDGEAVLLNLQTGVYFGLNASATRAWIALKRTGDPAQMLNEMQHCYGQPAPTLWADLSAWLDELERCGLVQRAGQPDATTP